MAFIIDVFSRFIVGWQASTSLRSDLAIDALEMAIYARNEYDLTNVVHHSDRGVQPRFKESSQHQLLEAIVDVHPRLRLAFSIRECLAWAYVGSKGDSYDNALAGSFNSLYKTELIHRKGPWRNVEHVEWETLKDVDWSNNRRIHESLDYVPTVEFEAHCYESNESESPAALEMI